MSSPIAGAAFINAILFAAYGQTKHQLNLYRGRKPDEIMPLSEIALAGAVAGFVNCIAAGPVELVKTQMQVQYNAVGQKAKYRYDHVIQELKPKLDIPDISMLESH